MWTVPFKEYLKFEGTKEGIKQVKARKKGEGHFFGYSVEEGITKIVSDIPGFEVKVLPPQYDIGFGADIQVSYQEQGKNYSFFADITTNKEKHNVTYLTATGSMAEDISEAFCYRTEYFSVRFGIKERHMNHFFYEKPVVVLLIDNYTPTTGLGLHHIHVIGSLMQNLNSLLMKRGYGARASQLIRPNPKKHPQEFRKNK